ncbi:MAG: hypothetical protein IIT68_07230 [Treponema sp.]|nr:hypothetical protein [Treponema sp.]
MTKKKMYALITASIALLVPAPGRFAYGLILVVLLMLLVTLGTVFRYWFTKLSLTQLLPALLAVMLISVVVLYKQLIILYAPFTALVMGFTLYLPALSAFVISTVHHPSEQSLAAQVHQNGIVALKFSITALAFFLFRDIFGFGTITFPTHTGLWELQLIQGADKNYLGTFWASVPGALIIIACVTALLSFVSRHFAEVEEAIDAE